VTARDPRALVREYHQQTKHRFDRFARSLGYLDWATQPDPFRSYEGARRIDLVGPFADASAAAWDQVDYTALFEDAPAPRVAPGVSAVSIFLRFSLGLSAWKQAGPSRWALRVNPSSGNLHPTEGYVAVAPGVVGVDAAVCHYGPEAHVLHERCVVERRGWQAAMGNLPAGSFVAALTSIHWREAWKYGERAFRYCQHDVGHAVAALRFAAALIGWRCRLVSGWTSEDLAALLGVDRDEDFEGAEREEPACLMVVSPGPVLGEPEQALAQAAQRGRWAGRANRLSADHVPWEWVDTVAWASRQEPVAQAVVASPDRPTAVTRALVGDGAWPAHRLLLQRRSAQAMDGRTMLGLDRFVTIVRRLLPEVGAPFDVLAAPPRIHLACFIHRVEGLEPGLYAVVRSAVAAQDGPERLARACHGDFAWVRPEGVPEDLPFYLLAAADARRIARQLSCAQDIAADGCFSLGMLAEFDAALEARGAAAYRELFWEAGAIGQLLYLEAEAAGLRGTGIGCYFDDGVHDLLGIRDTSLQSLYHFTVGMPVDDARLSSLPGYPWG
jgi:SagB-type dehydrogenase family enzyme